MYGVQLEGRRWAKSKKEIKETPHNRIYLEDLSFPPRGYSGYLDDAPDGTYTFVGPDPYNNRKFYGNIKKSGESIKIT